MIPQTEPDYGDVEAAAVRAYLDSGGWITEFRQTEAFEARLAALTGARHCTAVTSGTMALFAMLHACGVGQGDEVIVPDMTMIATATAVLLCGATPVLADIEEETLCLDLARAEAAITPRTRAMIVVDLNGRAPNMQTARALCGRRGILLLEDAAQALGSRWRGQGLGTFGTAAALSFSAPKIITTGQGGAVLTNDAGMAARLAAVKDFGRVTPGVDVHASIGFNLKFTDLQAAFGLAQLASIDRRIARKKAIFARYRELLGGVPGVRFLATDLAETTPWFMDIFVDDPDRLAALLADSGIGSRRIYPALHAQPALARTGHFPAADRAAATGLWLPSSLKLTDEQISRVCDVIISSYR